MPSHLEIEMKEDSFSFLEFAIALAKHKFLVLTLPLIAALASGLWIYSRPDDYTAKAVIIPPQMQQQSAASLLAQFGPAATTSIAGFANFRNSGEIFLGVVRSRTVADAVVKRLDLGSTFNLSPREAQIRLSASTNVLLNKEGLIEISVTTQDAQQAAQLTNAVLDEFSHLLATLAIDDAKQRRQYYEKELAQTKDSLIKAESAAKLAIGQKGLVNIDSQGRTLVETAARLRGQKSALEIRISSLQNYVTENNPELQKARGELAALNAELARLEGNAFSSNTSQAEDRRGLDSLRLLRELKFYETVSEALTKQVEIAKLDESKEFATVQVVDRAIAPATKSGPHRIRIIFAASSIALIIAAAIALLLEKINAAKKLTITQNRLMELKSLLAIKKN